MKPHIIMVVTSPRWLCSGGGFIGRGETPRTAYDRWKRKQLEHERDQFRLDRRLCIPNVFDWR